MKLFSHIADFLFPAECHVCGSPLAPHERFACTHCLDSLPRTGYHRSSPNPMEEKFAGIFPFERATGHFFYTRDSAISTLVQDMKYRHFPDIGNLLGSLAASDLFATGFFSEIDAIVPVPMHFFKQAIRGYNQTHHISAGISEAAGIPVVQALKASRPHRTQTSLSREERLSNTSRLFTAVDPEGIKGKHLLLVDDICTTGATLTAAAEALWKASPASLSLFAIAIAF